MKNRSLRRIEAEIERLQDEAAAARFGVLAIMGALAEHSPSTARLAAEMAREVANTLAQHGHDRSGAASSLVRLLEDTLPPVRPPIAGPFRGPALTHP